MELWLARTATILEPLKLAGDLTAPICCTPDDAPNAALEERVVAGAATADPATAIAVDMAAIVESTLGQGMWE